MKKRTSKDAFADALIALAKETPVERITVKQIVELSGLSLQTFYNHFRDKNELVLWLHRRMGERTQARIQKGKCGFHELLMDAIHFYEGNAGYLIECYGVGLDSPYAEVSAEIFQNILAAYVHKRQGPEALSEELSFYIRMYINTAFCMFAEWVRRDRDIPAERLALYLERGMPEALKPYLLKYAGV